MASNFDGSFGALRWHLHDRSEMPVSWTAVLVVLPGCFGLGRLTFPCFGRGCDLIPCFCELVESCVFGTRKSQDEVWGYKTLKDFNLWLEVGITGLNKSRLNFELNFAMNFQPRLRLTHISIRWLLSNLPAEIDVNFDPPDNLVACGLMNW